MKQSIYCDTDVWKYSISVNQCYINLWSLGHRAIEMTRINEDESRNNQVTSLKESEMHLKVWSFSKFLKSHWHGSLTLHGNTTKLCWRKYGEHILIFMKVVAALKLFHIMKTSVSEGYTFFFIFFLSNKVDRCFDTVQNYISTFRYYCSQQFI